MKKQAYLIWGYAALLVLGGFIGFIKAGSLPSLIASLIFATTLGATGFGVWKEKVMYFKASLMVLGSLIGFFAYRFLSSTHFFPSGFMALVTLIIFTLLIAKKSQAVSSL